MQSIQHTSIITGLIASPNLLTWLLKRNLVEPMEYIEAWLMQQVRHVLDCIAANTNYLFTYIYIFIYNRVTILVICQLQNEKSNFPKLWKANARLNQKQI